MLKIQSLFIGVLLYFISSSVLLFSNADLFDTRFLKQPHEVQKFLISQKGFSSGYFTTRDKCALHYLFKKQPNARYTIICASGFYPGRKEGMATLCELLPADCNLLLFDARGRGHSTGFYYSLWRYGVDESQDIQAAIEFAQKKDSCPIVLYGICAGAFHAAHAVCNNPNANVRGLIMDSAWSSVTQVSHSALKSELKKRVLPALSRQLNSDLLKKIMCASSTKLINAGSYLIHKIVFTPALYFYRNTTDLIKRISALNIPILFIHSEDDDYVDIAQAKNLARHAPHAYCWWITQPSRHAAHHLKHSQQYRITLSHFLNTIVCSTYPLP